MTKRSAQFLIAAPCSGSGKTTVSRGLMAALVRRGLTVQPYKCGPDYIDTTFHSKVCHRPSVNLDLFMASQAHVSDLYSYYAQGADVCVVEGMMGLFDGYQRNRGSSSDVAEVLDLPVILVVDAHSTAYSIAALLKGFLTFRSETHIAGILFNRIGSPHHYQLVKEACDDLDVPCLGYLPKDKALEHGSRYLGLDISEEHDDSLLDHLIEQIESHIDIPRLLQLVSRPLELREDPFRHRPAAGWHTVVMRDADSFAFLYTEHLEILSRMGRVSFLAPEENLPLPQDTDLLYLPGGYPEKHAQQLSEASLTLRSIHDYIEAGGRALAECGGMIYLSQGVHFDEAPHFVPLCQLLPFAISCRQADRKLSLGYRQFSYNGQPLRGHEFHYTQFYQKDRPDFPASAVQMLNAREQAVPTPLFRYKNLITSYTHLYWGEADLLKLFQ